MCVNTLTDEQKHKCLKIDLNRVSVFLKLTNSHTDKHGYCEGGWGGWMGDGGHFSSGTGAN